MREKSASPIANPSVIATDHLAGIGRAAEKLAVTARFVTVPVAPLSTTQNRSAVFSLLSFRT